MDQIIINNDTLSEDMGAEQPDAEIKKLTKKSFPVFFILFAYNQKIGKKHWPIFVSAKISGFLAVYSTHISLLRYIEPPNLQMYKTVFEMKILACIS